MRCVASAAVLLAVLAPAQAAPPAAGRAVTRTADQAMRLATMPLTIRVGRHAYRFRVEVARTPAEQERGLMFRESVPPFGGMLFPFDPPRPASFWMKNTLVPLDMLFVRTDGSIARVAQRTTPLTLDPIEVGEPLAAVLELKGGRAAALGITEAAHVGWRGGPAR